MRFTEREACFDITKPSKINSLNDILLKGSKCMFTGIVEELGIIQAIERGEKSARFYIQSSSVLDDAKEGDSISINGCCLTIVQRNSHQYTCDVVQETLHRTNLKHLKAGDRVNLERAVRYQDRMGGHLVQGHIDETGTILSKDALGDGSWWMTIKASPQVMRYLIFKGSIAIDGVSLTIADLNDETFSFAMIPYTAQMTTLGFKQIGELVNLEIDLMAKYVEKLISHSLNVSLKGSPC